MPRYKLILEYDGGAFVGWQRQDNGPSVQAAVEAAVHAFSGETVTAHCAGRTDSGVHALGQAAHIELARPREAHVVRNAVNHHLGRTPVKVLAAEAVGADFHARFSATHRAYLYRILNRPGPPVLDRGRVWWVPRPLDAGAMAEAATVLTGHHDFTSFRATECQAASPEKTLDRLEVLAAGPEIHVTARARSFLHHMVRNLVGTLVLVGKGKWGRADVEAALAARDRRAAGPTAPAEGLYMTDVGYDGDGR